MIDRTRIMYEMYEAGETLEEVGKRFGLSRERVRQLFADAGLKTRTRGEAKQVARERALLRARATLRNEDVINAELARRYGTTLTALRRARRS